MSGAAACSGPAALVPDTHHKSPRLEAFRRASVWLPSDVETANIRSGPAGSGRFPFLALVTCTYVEKPWHGHTLKFACDVGEGDIVKIKIGRTNGEVYGEVAATRLLWALGFPADRMYPVRVLCRQCPSRFGGQPSAEGRLFDSAAIERPLAGAEFDDGAGWSWAELDSVDVSSGGAPVAHRDALKLLAVFLQHTDTKPEQQRLICRDEPALTHPDRCGQPLLMLDDLGLTFGSANFLNTDVIGGVNFEEWSKASVWAGDAGCVGNLARSLTGTLTNPRIGEEGRQMLSGLLERLSQRQIRDLFEISRFDQRSFPGSDSSARPTIDDWIGAFNQKRAEIRGRRCA
jgi:hypothetical protein